MPIRLLANMPNAVAMRIGNTAEELAQSDWLDYSAESYWWAPTGTGHSVYVEFRLANGTTTTLNASVPPFDVDGSTDFIGVMPVSPLLPHPSLGGAYWVQDFEIGRDGWSSYNGAPGGVAEYMPVSHSLTGGSGGGAYVWADNSRWAPLADGNMLALVVEPDWANPRRPTVDFSGKTLNFSLNEDGLSAGTTGYLWIKTAAGSWRSAEELDLGTGGWTANSLLLAANPANWVALAGTSSGTPVDLTTIVSWGVLLDPAGASEPTGRLGIDSVTVVSPTPGPVGADNLTQTIAFTEGASSVAITGLHINAPASQELYLTLRFSDPDAAEIAGFGDPIDGGYVVQGTTSQLNALLATLALSPAANQDQDFTIAIEVRDDQVGAPVTSGTLSFDVGAVQDAATLDAASSGLSYRTGTAGVLLPAITVSDPDSNAQLTVTISQVSGPTARLIGHVTGSAGSYQITGSVEAVNAALKTLVFLPPSSASGPAVFDFAVSDGIQSQPAEQTITLTPLVPSQAATGIVLPAAPIAIAETSANGTVVAVLNGTDAYGTAYSFQLADDADGRFSIAANGTLTVTDTYAIDFEQATSHQITVLATDAAGGVIERTVTVAVNDVQAEVIHGDGRDGAAYGGVGNDYFYPSAGADLMAGGVGDDFYQVQHEGDLVLEKPGEGTNDQIVTYQSYALAPGSEVERLSVVYSYTTEALTLLGNEFAQAITGNDGNNRISGGGGLDTLTGLLGRDTFVIDSAFGAGNVSTITDFTVGTDLIELSGTPFAALTAGGLTAAAFHVGATATDAAQRILYDSATGRLSYDADGSGSAAAVVFAKLAAGLALTADDFVVTHPLSAADLSPGQFLVDGLRGESPQIYSYPVTLYSNIPDAVEMRFGNTREELAGADWQDYSDTASWLVKSGFGIRPIYAEFRLANGTIQSTSALTPDFDRTLDAQYHYAADDSEQIGRSDGMIWANRFEDDVHRWASYDYRSGSHELSEQNVFYQATWAETGGVGDGGYVWIDDSRWVIDREAPTSILSLLTYPGWLGNDQVLDLTGTTVEFYLKGDQLDLNGGEAYFWVLDANGRWKDYTVELNIGDGEWAYNSLTLDTSRLTSSWNHTGAPLDLTQIFSWGIAFVGFDEGQEPTGTIMLDEFVIRKAEPLLAEGLNQTYVVNASTGSLALAPIEIHHPSPSSQITVTFTFSDPAAGSIAGAHNEGGGVFTLTGTVTEINDALSAITVVRNTGFPGDAAIVVSVDDGVAETGDPRGVIMLDVIDRLFGTAAGETLQAPTIDDWQIYGLGGNDLLVGSGGNDILRGGAGDDVLLGGAGNDQLVADDGVDRSQGGLGDDWYFVDNAADLVVENAGEGRDIVYSTVDYALGTGVSVEVLSAATQAATTALNLTGNEIANLVVGNAGSNVLKGLAGDDWLTGLAGNDQLAGGSGVDITDGGLGDDWHFVDSIGDRVAERAGEGRDIVYSTVDYVLGAGVSVEVLSAATQAATSALNLAGNEIANYIVGNAGSNLLNGNAGDDWLTGLAGNDQLVGGTGVDITDGGLGDDWHFVDNAADRVVERAGEGYDTVYATVDYVLGTGVSVEALSAASQAATNALNLAGNEIANVLVGNAGSNVLKGLAGDDWLVGLAGNDQLIGGAGIDVTDGGLGDDWHFVDDAADRVVERAGEGRDIIYTTVDYVLGAGVWIETLSASTQAATNALNLAGNEIDNFIVGNAGSNLLNGNAGADWLTGLAGNDQLVGGLGADTTDGGLGDDWHFVDNAADLVVERANEGYDTVYTTVDYVLGTGVSAEALSAATQAGTSALTLTGNEIGNVIVGNAGDNVIDGKLGADWLIGLGGADTFAFTTALGGTNVDVIEGFAPGTDKIRLDDAVFTGLTPGSLSADAFVIGSVAADTTDRIIYNSATGALFFDADGTGGSGPIQFAQLSAGLTNLAATDFIVA